MNEIAITVNYENERPTVSGRELHRALEVKTKYTDWFKRMCEYGFAENSDYVLVSQKRETNNPKNPNTEFIDHYLLYIALYAAHAANLYFIFCRTKQQRGSQKLRNNFQGHCFCFRIYSRVYRTRSFFWHTRKTTL